MCLLADALDIVTSLLTDGAAKEEDASDGRATPGVDQDM